MTRNVIQKFETIVLHLIGTGGDSLSSIDVSSQFNPSDSSEADIGRNLNAAFLVTLSGKSHPLYEEANQYLNMTHDNNLLQKMVAFCRHGQKLLIGGFGGESDRFTERVAGVLHNCEAPADRSASGQPGVHPTHRRREVA